MKKPQMPIDILYYNLVKTTLNDYRKELIIENIDRLEEFHQANIRGFSGAVLRTWSSRNETNSYIQDHYLAMMLVFRNKKC